MGRGAVQETVRRERGPEGLGRTSWPGAAGAAALGGVALVASSACIAVASDGGTLGTTTSTLAAAVRHPPGDRAGRRLRAARRAAPRPRRLGARPPAPAPRPAAGGGRGVADRQRVPGVHGPVRGVARPPRGLADRRGPVGLRPRRRRARERDGARRLHRPRARHAPRRGRARRGPRARPGRALVDGVAPRARGAGAGRGPARRVVLGAGRGLRDGRGGPHCRPAGGPVRGPAAQANCQERLLRPNQNPSMTLVPAVSPWTDAAPRAT